MSNLKHTTTVLEQRRPKPSDIHQILETWQAKLATLTLLGVADYNGYYSVLNNLFTDIGEELVYLLTAGVSVLTLLAGSLVGRLVASAVPARLRKVFGAVKAGLLVCCFACLVMANVAARIATQNGLDAVSAENYQAGVAFMAMLLVFSFMTAVVMSAETEAVTSDDDDLKETYLEALMLLYRKLELLPQDDNLAFVNQNNRAKLAAAKNQVSAQFTVLKEKTRLSLLAPTKTAYPEAIYAGEFAERRPGLEPEDIMAYMQPLAAVTAEEPTPATDQLPSQLEKSDQVTADAAITPSLTDDENLALSLNGKAPRRI